MNFSSDNLLANFIVQIPTEGASMKPIKMNKLLWINQFQIRIVF